MKNPISLIEQSIQDATEKGDPNAELLFLATSNVDAQPSVRTLLLRAVTGRSIFILFSRFHQKWQDLQETGNYEVLLWYPSIGHQYRIRGTFRELSPAEIEARWRDLPDMIKAVDLAYDADLKPGIPIDSPDIFRNRVNALKEDVSASPPPSHLIGAWLDVTFVEFLGASMDRLHDRTQFHWQDGQWLEQDVIP